MAANAAYPAILANCIFSLSHSITAPIGDRIFSFNGSIYLPDHQLIPDAETEYIPDVEIEFDIFLINPNDGHLVINIGHPHDYLWELPKLLLNSNAARPSNEWIFLWDYPYDTGKNYGYFTPTLLPTGQWTHIYCRANSEMQYFEQDGIGYTNKISNPEDLSSSDTFGIYIGGDGQRQGVNATMRNISIYSVPPEQLESAQILTLKSLNGIMSCILFIYGAFIIFATIQDLIDNGKARFHEVPLGLEISNVMPAWLTALNFFVYLGFRYQPFDKHKALLLSVAQFQWIINNTFSMFCDDYMQMSSGIYMVYDHRKMEQYEEKMKNAPQNEYLVHGLFRLLSRGKDFGIWTSRMYQDLPSFPPEILDIFAEYIVDKDLYEFPNKDKARIVNQEKRDKVAKVFIMVANFITLVDIIIVSMAWNTRMLEVFIIMTIIIDGLMTVFHLVFSIRAIGVLMYLKDGNHLKKYKLSLICSWIVMISELIILALFVAEGVRDDLWSINSLMIIHSMGLLGWYTIWVVEQVFVSLGKYDHGHYENGVNFRLKERYLSQL